MSHVPDDNSGNTKVQSKKGKYSSYDWNGRASLGETLLNPDVGIESAPDIVNKITQGALLKATRVP